SSEALKQGSSAAARISGVPHRAKLRYSGPGSIQEERDGPNRPWHGYLAYADAQRAGDRLAALYRARFAAHQYARRRRQPDQLRRAAEARAAGDRPGDLAAADGDAERNRRERDAQARRVSARGQARRADRGRR